MPRRLAAYVQDAVDMCDNILTIVEGLEQEDYIVNFEKRFAVERCFQIIGEALVEMRKRDRELFDQIEAGGDIIAFRNIIVHGYFTLRHDRVWSSISDELPMLRLQLLALLDNNPSD